VWYYYTKKQQFFAKVMECEANEALVVDNGSETIKAGFSGDDAPCSVLMSLVGRPRPEVKHAHNKEVYVGNETQVKCSELKLTSPIEGGIITSWAWDDMEKIWHHTYYNELRVAPEEHTVMLTESPLNRKANREHMARIHFENFSVPAMHVQNECELSLYASGRTTGCVFDSGDGASNVVSVYEGWAIPKAVRRVRVAGRDLTEWMAGLLRKKGYTFQDTFYPGRKIVRDIKEKLCYVAVDYGNEMKKARGSAGLAKDYTLPDGNVIQVNTARFNCPEAFFKPEFVASRGCYGLNYNIADAIQKCMDIRKDLFQNIVCSGGSTMFDGLAERIVEEITALCDRTMIVKTIALQERKHSVWIGGSILSALATFQSMWIAKAEYDEAGPTVVHRKTF